MLYSLIFCSDIHLQPDSIFDSTAQSYKADILRSSSPLSPSSPIASSVFSGLSRHKLPSTDTADASAINSPAAFILPPQSSFTIALREKGYSSALSFGFFPPNARVYTSFSFSDIRIFLQIISANSSALHSHGALYPLSSNHCINASYTG